jgi:hypothetical protein
MGVNDGEHKPLGIGAGTVFDGDVPDDRVVEVGLMAFDEDSHKDWSHHGELTKKVGHSVAEGLRAIPHPYTAAAGTVLPFAVAGLGLAMSMDRDDELGQHLRDFPVGAWPNGEHRQVWHFSKRGSRWSNWNCGVGYRFIKG